MCLSRDPIPTSPGGDDHGEGCQVAGLEGKRINGVAKPTQHKEITPAELKNSSA